MIDRRVRVVDSQGSGGGQVRRFSEFASTRNLVLLGDPGGGKTKLFQDVAGGGAGQYLKTRIFLLTPANQLEKTIFIDALDEQRAATDDITAVDAVVLKLLDSAPEKVRISCREQDWLGDTDLAALGAYFAGNGGATVLRLVAIDRAEQIGILDAQGVKLPEAETFLANAQAKGLGELVLNPYKMLMLSRVVRSGVWPTSTSDLFRRATDLQLEEANRDHARTRLGRFTAEDLRLTAGAICATRLIADVEGVCLEETGPNEHYPGYRSLDFLDPAKAQAVLHRPFFISTGTPKCVDYDHRTSAEFLAAHWIAHQVRNGLPIGRVQALIGVGGHPAAELRGLHAWLPIALPAYARLFIDRDPLGVLEYGDAASLSPGDRGALLSALAALAKENPWFLGRDRNAAAIGQLVQADSIGALCDILAAPESPGDLRTLALEAFGAATPQQAAFATLDGVFSDARCGRGDRSRALDCLVAFGDRGIDAVRKAYPDLSGDTEDVLRLRTRVLQLLYGRGVGADLVIALILDLLEAQLDTTIGLWDLADNLPARDLAKIADGISLAAPDLDEDRHRTAWDVAAFVNRVLDRASQEVLEDLTGAQVFRWIELRHHLRGLSDDARKQTFFNNIKTRNDLVRAIFDAAIDAQSDEDTGGCTHSLFHDVLGRLTTTTEICEWCLDRLQTESDVPKRSFLYNFAANLCRDNTPAAMAHFERVYALSEDNPDFANLLAPYLVCNIEKWRSDDRERTATRAREREGRHTEDRRRFAEERDQVRLGQSGLLHFAADIYFAMYADFNEKVSPHERIAEYLSDVDAEAVLAGLQAFATARTNTPPDLEKILDMRLKNLRQAAWRTFAAGVDTIVRDGGVAQLPAPLVRSVMAIDVFESLSDRVKRKNHDPHSMQEILRRVFPEIAAEVYARIVEFDLTHKSGGAYIHGFFEYLGDEVFRTSRRHHLLDWLIRFKDLEPRQVEHMLDVALGDDALHPKLKQQSAAALADPGLPPAHRPLWLATAYLVDPVAARPDVAAAIIADPRAAWALRDALGYESRVKQTSLWPLSPDDLGFLIAEIGAAWPRTDFPNGVVHGNTNPADATRFISSLIDRLSSVPAPEATRAFEALIGDPRLVSYLFGLKHALAQQQVRRREQEYDRPDWKHTVAALANHAPANAADLHAFTLDHLRSLAASIDGSNTDQFKLFWNENTHGNPTTPKVEESGRHALVTLLKPRLEPFGLNVEPEALMSARKRVDIAVLGAGIKTVVEVKLSHSPDLWKAMETQLDALYTRDPATKGFGILLVLWFGGRSSKRVTKRKSDGWIARSASDLEAEIAAQNRSSKLSVIVIDVSGERPASPPT